MLRFVLASLVIFSHCFELVDGNRSRELFSRVFGTLSAGNFAVCGFFIISGYLITASWLASTPAAYLLKRALRIYPGFIAAFIVSAGLCLWVSPHLRPMPGGLGLENFINLCALAEPSIPNAYPGLPYPSADGPMWTISYEFRCYLAMMALGGLGLLQRQNAILLLAWLLTVAFMVIPGAGLSPGLAAAPPDLAPWLRVLRRMTALAAGQSAPNVLFFGLFLTGCSFFILREQIPYRAGYAALAAAGLVFCLFFNLLAEAGLAVFGGYLIVWFALHVRPFALSRLLDSTDLSYGMYLYGWPVEKLLIFEHPHITPYELLPAAFAISLGAAWLSWRMVERPCLELRAVLLSRMRRGRAEFRLRVGGP